MEWNWKENNKQKHLFKSYYCAGCKQVKPCGILTGWDSEWKSYCCECYFQSWQARSQEHSDYQLVYQQEVKKQQGQYKQYQFLKNYLGCKECGSLAVDAYYLYENSQLVCQPCLVKKTGGSSSPISFSEKVKWYKKRWRISLIEWLEIYQCLPVNAECAGEWLKDKGHLKNCQCLEIEVKELVDLFTGSLQKIEQKLKDCQCVKSEKVRVSNDNYAWCERCEGTIYAASKKRVIKNRNDPRFWGVESEGESFMRELFRK